MTQIVFLDTETTGLDLERHEVWEIGMVMADSDGLNGEPEHALIRVEPVWLEDADPGAILVNGFYSKTEGMRYTSRASGVDPNGETWSDPHSAARYVCRLLQGAIVVGNNPAFDVAFLEKFAKTQSQVLAPFHRKINVVDMALQRCHDMRHHQDLEVVKAATQAIILPHSSSRVLDAAGCPPNHAAHTAMGDAWHVYHAFLHLTGVWP